MRLTRSLALICAVTAAPAIAQEEDGTAYTVDLLVRAPPAQDDEIAAEQCEEEADAARISGEIIVCRALEDTSHEVWNQDEWKRGYAQRTQGIKAPVFPTIYILPMVGISLRAEFGAAPEGPLLIDIEALPEPPEGSDADRIARGLPPIGDN